MFERYTDRARRVVVRAMEESRSMGHTHVATEHILLGLLYDRELDAAKTLESLGISLEAVRAHLGCYDERPIGSVVPFTPEAKHVLNEGALKVASDLKDTYIGPMHLLLSLLLRGPGDNTAIKVLVALGVTDLDELRDQVLQADRELLQLKLASKHARASNMTLGLQKEFEKVFPAMVRVPRRELELLLAKLSAAQAVLEGLLAAEKESPTCMTCGTPMRPAGTAFVCEGCGSTAGTA